MDFGQPNASDFVGDWIEVQGKNFFILEKPLPFIYIHMALPKEMGVRLIRYAEFMRMQAENFPFEEWNIMGEVWTGTKKSCSDVAYGVIKEDGKLELATAGRDKTFGAWVVAVRR